MHWILLALLSAIFAAAVAVLAKLGINNIDTTVATTVRSIVMTVVLLVASLATKRDVLTAGFDKRSLLFIIASGIAGALSWLCYFLALKFGSTSSVAALDRLSIVFVVILAAAFLGERLTWQTGVGALLITAGALLMIR
jgi:transporter family protein